MIVDDALDSLRFLPAMLNQQGYEVRCVTNGSTALIGVQGLVPDLILLHIQMPEMNGYKLPIFISSQMALQIPKRWQPQSAR
nr:response regulator [Leptolyngbya sp. FACHB-541]